MNKSLQNTIVEINQLGKSSIFVSLNSHSMEYLIFLGGAKSLLSTRGGQGAD